MRYGNSHPFNRKTKKYTVSDNKPNVYRENTVSDLTLQTLIDVKLFTFIRDKILLVKSTRIIVANSP